MVFVIHLNKGIINPVLLEPQILTLHSVFWLSKLLYGNIMCTTMKILKQV